MMWKSNLLCALALVALSSCGSQPTNSIETMFELPRGVEVEDGFSMDERKAGDQYVGITDQGSKYSITPMTDRYGVLASLIQSTSGDYSMYSYNPMFGDWNLRCEANPINDRMECRLDYSVLSFFGSNPASLTQLCINEHDYPGETASIRLNDDRAVNLGEDGCITSKSFVNRVLRAEKVAVKYVNWPYDAPSAYTLREFNNTDVVAFISNIKKRFLSK